MNYLNVGCGDKYRKDWVNIDLVSNSPDVIACNVLKGIPFPDEKFDVVYHSQMLEHFPKEKALDFIQECTRVLKKGGILRVVVPDLENIVDEYKKCLHNVVENPTPETKANYDWILLEMYDQTVRNATGGHMASYLQQKNMVNEQHVIDRIGHVGRLFRENAVSGANEVLKRNMKALGMRGFAKKGVGYARRKMLNALLGKKYALGDFRLGGEIHLWMYDRYSLSRLLQDAGLKETKVQSPSTSDIPDWNTFALDVKDGLPYDPTSLFVEARK